MQDLRTRLAFRLMGAIWQWRLKAEAPRRALPTITLDTSHHPVHAGTNHQKLS